MAFAIRFPVLLFTSLFWVAGVANAKEVVGVMSLFGDHAKLLNAELAVDEEQEKEVNVKEWNIDSYTENSYLSEISKYPHLAGVKVSAKEELENHVETSYDLFTGYDLTDESIKSLSTKARKLGLNKLIVITKDGEYNYKGIGDVVAHGYGLIYRMGYLYSYLVGHVYLLDVVKEKQLEDLKFRTFDEVKLLGVLSNSQKQDLFEFIEENVDKGQSLEEYRSVVFAKKVTKNDRERILKKFEAENGWNEYIDDQMMLLWSLVYPIHHKLGEFHLLPKEENRKLQQEIEGVISQSIKKSVEKLFR